MRFARGSLLAVAVLLAAGRARGGDPDVADLLLKKARKSFAAKDYKEAEAGYRRALKEVTPFPDARFGLAEALEKLDRPREAIEEYRNCVGEINGAGVPAKWKPLLTRAQQALSRLQGRNAELAKLNEGFIRRCIDFAKKHAKSDPGWARSALDAVLVLDPGNEIARGLLKTLPAADTAPAPKAAKGTKREDSLFRRDLWDGPSEWTVDTDTITGNVREDDGKIFWLDRMAFAGHYTVRGRVRLTRDGGPRRAYGIFLGGDGKHRWWEIVFDDHEQLVLDRWDDGQTKPAEEFMLVDHDHNKWHTLEIVVDRGSIKVSLDGKEVMTRDETELSCFDGKISLFVQNACVEWKDLR